MANGHTHRSSNEGWYTRFISDEENFFTTTILFGILTLSILIFYVLSR